MLGCVVVIFEGGGNLTASAKIQSEVFRRTKVLLPLMLQWNDWRASGAGSMKLNGSLVNASLDLLDIRLTEIRRHYPLLPAQPWGVFLGDEPPFELVQGRLADAAAAIKHRYPAAITAVNLNWVTIVNASVPPILGAATGLDWVGADLYYNDLVAHPILNASVHAMRDAYERVLYPHLRPDQKIVLVPWAQYCAFYCPIGPLPLAQADAYTLSVGQAYTEWAETDSRVAALTIFNLKMVWTPAGSDPCENPAYQLGQGNLTRVPWRTNWAGNGIGLTDTCLSDATLTAGPCNSGEAGWPIGPLAHLRAQWVLGKDGLLVLGASPTAAPMCFTHLIPRQSNQCTSPMHRTTNSTTGVQCDDYLGEPTAGLGIGACNSTAAVLQRQRWSCLDATNCQRPSRIQASGPDVGCERLPGFQPPKPGIPISCCLVYVGGTVEAFGLQQCGGTSSNQHFVLTPVVASGPPRVTIEVVKSGAKQCVHAAESGAFALPRTVGHYQEWGSVKSDDGELHLTVASWLHPQPPQKSRRETSGGQCCHPRQTRSSCWGFTGVDDTRALQAMLNCTTETLLIENNGRPWITAPLWIVPPSRPHPQCMAALESLCGGARNASPGNCLVCCGMHQAQLQVAHCLESGVESFCNGAARQNRSTGHPKRIELEQGVIIEALRGNSSSCDHQLRPSSCNYLDQETALLVIADIDDLAIVGMLGDDGTQRPTLRMHKEDYVNVSLGYRKAE